jgi:hypothetical protein
MITRVANGLVTTRFHSLMHKKHIRSHAVPVARLATDAKQAISFWQGCDVAAKREILSVQKEAAGEMLVQKIGEEGGGGDLLVDIIVI